MDIPYEGLRIGDKIGSGRFSTVHAGNWHGDAAIKFLDMENLDDENTLEAFRLDVATFRKTRHENLVLFMGACMKPPRLAIITSLCKGNTLYTHLHLRRDKFYMNKVIIIAQQIAQGMGYLHHKGIVHKDLKTKKYIPGEWESYYYGLWSCKCCEKTLFPTQETRGYRTY